MIQSKDPSDPGQLFDRHMYVPQQWVHNKINGVDYVRDFIDYAVACLAEHMDDRDEDFDTSKVEDFEGWLQHLIVGICFQNFHPRSELLLMVDANLSVHHEDEELRQLMKLFAEWVVIHQFPFEKFQLVSVQSYIPFDELHCGCGQLIKECEEHRARYNDRHYTGRYRVAETDIKKTER